MALLLRKRLRRLWDAVKSISRERTPEPSTYQALGSPAPTAAPSTISNPAIVAPVPASLMPANPYQNLVPTDDDDSPVDMGINMLMDVIERVKECSDVFPPLKSASAGLLEVLKRIRVRPTHFSCSRLTAHNI